MICHPFRKSAAQNLPNYISASIFSNLHVSIFRTSPSGQNVMCRMTKYMVQCLPRMPCWLQTACWISKLKKISISDKYYTSYLPSVLWHCWLGIRKSTQPVKKWVMMCWHGYRSAARCRWFAYSPADAIPSPRLIKILTGLALLVPPYSDCAGKEATTDSVQRSGYNCCKVSLDDFSIARLASCIPPRIPWMITVWYGPVDKTIPCHMWLDKLPRSTAVVVWYSASAAACTICHQTLPRDRTYQSWRQWTSIMLAASHCSDSEIKDPAHDFLKFLRSLYNNP